MDATTLALAGLFWLVVLSAAYAYALYPALLAVAAPVLDRTVDRGPVTPGLSVVVAAYNEEDVIAAKLESILASDYPEEALEVLVASDGSTDATEEVAGRYADRGVRVLSLPRRGKAHALEAAARRASGEVLVLTDANSRLEPGALRALARNFADPEVGGVAGHTGYEVPADGQSSGRGEDLYWRYDTWLKRAESRTGSVVSAHGGLYAVRRELFRPPEDAAVTDDFAISTAVVEQGRRLVFEPEARAVEEAPREAGEEFRRRVRLTVRGLRSLLLRRGLLNPLRHGFYSLALFSHKVVRRLLPAGLPLLLLAGAALSPGRPVYQAATGLQLLFYGLAAAGFALRGTPLGKTRPFYVPFYFTLSNAAALVALLRVAGGERIERWDPQARPAGGGSRETRGSPGHARGSVP